MRKWFDFSKKEIVRIADLGNIRLFIIRINGGFFFELFPFLESRTISGFCANYFYQPSEHWDLLFTVINALTPGSRTAVGHNCEEKVLSSLRNNTLEFILVHSKVGKLEEKL